MKKNTREWIEDFFFAVMIIAVIVVSVMYFQKPFPLGPWLPWH